MVNNQVESLESSTFDIDIDVVYDQINNIFPTFAIDSLYPYTCHLL